MAEVLAKLLCLVRGWLKIDPGMSEIRQPEMSLERSNLVKLQLRYAAEAVGSETFEQTQSPRRIATITLQSERRARQRWFDR